MPAPGQAYIPSAFEQLISDRAKRIIQTLHDFIYDEVMPTEKLFEAQMPADRWSSIPPVVDELKKKAKALGLWNLFLHKGYKEGPGLTNLEYAIMAELTGLTRLAPEVLLSHVTTDEIGDELCCSRYREHGSICKVRKSRAKEEVASPLNEWGDPFRLLNDGAICLKFRRKEYSDGN